MVTIEKGRSDRNFAWVSGRILPFKIFGVFKSDESDGKAPLLRVPTSEADPDSNIGILTHLILTVISVVNFDTSSYQ